MESFEYNDNICRVCLGPNVVVNWDEVILDLDGPTYKDIYYKYTHLETFVTDPYSQMLCEPCSQSLKSSHDLITKALESHYILESTFSTGDAQDICQENDKREPVKDDIVCETKYEPPTHFEVLLFEQPKDSSSDENEEEHKKNITKIEISNESPQGKRKRRIAPKPKWLENSILADDDDDDSECDNRKLKKRITINNTSKGTNKLSNAAKGNKSADTPFKDNVNNEPYTENEENIAGESKTDDNNGEILKTLKKRTQNVKRNSIQNKKTPETRNADEGGTVKSGTATKTNTKPKHSAFMCSQCPKRYNDRPALLRHEESHKEHRERSVVCPQCGIKFYFKSDLEVHIKIHDKNREKKHKCEFCDKAYYAKGDLNVHRRAHLGQMIPCSLCPKEYHRQVDLDRHNRVEHSEIPLHSELKKAPKYVVYCKECNKNLSTSRWAAHQAGHLKKPLMKCSICDKDFFSRSTCTYHMNKVHSIKKREEYEPLIIYLKTTRTSHLLLKQHEMVQTKSD